MLWLWWYRIQRNKRLSNLKFRNLFNQSTNKDYYKPIKTTSVFDNKNNYIEYESNGDKDNILSVKEYLHIISPCLSNMINSRNMESSFRQ